MFEKTKDKAFQEGIVFASNADSKKISMQEAAFNEERKNLSASMEKFHEQLNILVSECEEKELERVYGLRQEFNYDNLEPEQKRLIIAILYSFLKHSSEAQKMYVLNLQNFFGITPQVNYNIDMLSDNDDLSTFANRCIFKIVSEFFYLGDETFSFLDDTLYQKICEYINLNQKKKDEILDSIREISSMDPAFIIAQYGADLLLSPKDTVTLEPVQQDLDHTISAKELIEENVASITHTQESKEKKTNAKMIIPPNVEISRNMKTLVNLINENANTNYQMGKIRLQGYCSDVWAYLNYDNKMFGIDLNKKKRDSYEGSMDMKDMAVAMAYRSKLDFIPHHVIDRIIKGLQPSTNLGKAIWDDILVKMVDTLDEDVIAEIPALLCTDEGKERFRAALQDKNITYDEKDKD